MHGHIEGELRTGDQAGAGGRGSRLPPSTPPRAGGVAFLLAAGIASSCAPPMPREPAEAAVSTIASTTEEVDLSRFFPKMDGTFVVLDVERGALRVHDTGRAAERFLPASTFKIPNTLIALETGIVDGAEFRLRWDSVAAPPASFWPASWKGEQTLRSAFQNSVYWFYQELARRIGEPRMREHLRRFEYGNRDIDGGIDRFWLSGELRISPLEQVDFLRRMLSGELGVSERSTRIVRDLMLLEDSTRYRLSGKTGTADVTPTRELGWLVGFLERGDALHIWALNMEGERVWEDWPPQKRLELVRQLLAELGLLE